MKARIGAERICGFMHTALAHLAEALETAPDTPVRRLEVLPAAERHRLLVEWNATEAEYPADKCVHELFEAQAARTPDAIAVEFEERAADLWRAERAGQSAGASSARLGRQAGRPGGDLRRAQPGDGGWAARRS